MTGHGSGCGLRRQDQRGRVMAIDPAWLPAWTRPSRHYGRLVETTEYWVATAGDSVDAAVRCGQPVVLAAGGAGRGPVAARRAAAAGRGDLGR